MNLNCRIILIFRIFSFIIIYIFFFKVVKSSTFKCMQTHLQKKDKITILPIREDGSQGFGRRGVKD